MPTEIPTLNFKVEDMLPADQFKDGPLLFMFNQDEFIPPSKPLDYAIPERTFLDRILKRRPWHVDIRLAPVANTDLEAWGKQLSARLDVPFKDNKADPENKAIWLPGIAKARTAQATVGGGARLMKKLEGFEVHQVQLWIHAYEETE